MAPGREQPAAREFFAPPTRQCLPSLLWDKRSRNFPSGKFGTYLARRSLVLRSRTARWLPAESSPPARESFAPLTHQCLPSVLWDKRSRNFPSGKLILGKCRPWKSAEKNGGLDPSRRSLIYQLFHFSDRCEISLYSQQYDNPIDYRQNIPKAMCSNYKR